MVRRATPAEVKRWLERHATRARPARGRRAGARARRAVRARRRRVRPAHVPVRPVGLGQDLLARRAARAASDGDQPAGRRARPELGLRAARKAADRADDEPAERYRAAVFPVGVRSGTSDEARIGVRFRGAQPGRPGGGAPARPGRRPRGVLGADSRSMEDAEIRSVEDLARSRAEALKQRARNLGVDRWGIWPGPEGAVAARRGGGRRPLRAASSSTSARSRRARSRSLAAGAVLERLWRERSRREPVAIVIDEAHNVCPCRARGPAHRPRHRRRDQDRRRGAQVRPLSHRRDPAAAEGARERRCPSATTSYSCG